MLTVFAGRQITQRVAWTLLVVLDAPSVSGLAHVVYAQEQVLVEQFLAEGPLEAFDVGALLVEFAGLDVLDRHTVGFRPLHEDLAQELGAVVVRSTCGRLP